MGELLYTVWLSLSCTPGSDSFKRLTDKFSSPKSIYEADETDIASCIGSKSRDYIALNDKKTDRAEEIIDFCERKGVGIVTYYDDEYPDTLRRIKNPPVLLYYRGTLPDFKADFLISVVGTRRLTEYGKKNAYTVSADLARAGAVIASGMAIGIDGVALAGALSTSSKTVAVIGSGIDVCYPIQHKHLAREIVKEGCVLTEYAPGTRPDKHNFPVRNRIISAISEATLVIEGKERSGAVITARHAKEQGKTVYALPGNVGNECSVATNLLIRNGARLFTSADDIIRDLESVSLGRLNPFKLCEVDNSDMNEVLSALQVSCITPNDSVFKRSFSKKAAIQNSTESPKSINANKQSETEVPRPPADFDKRSIRLYNKIPTDSDCTIESLIDDEFTLRDVMQGLLKLEIARFIVMLPGDRVKRITLK